VIVTGFPQDEALSHLGPLARGVLIKPFDPEILLLAISGSLDPRLPGVVP
jgi:hypothetical protein